MLKNSLFLLLFIFSQCLVHSQTLTQTIKGTIKDRDSKISLVGVTVVLQGTDPLLGTVTDVNGNFKLEKVPVGRYNVAVTYVGYEPVVLPNVTVSSGKEVALAIDLAESITTLEGVVITPDENQGEARNEFSTVSSRSFSIEESSKYAGTFNDPSRMVTTFAGVQGGGGSDDVENEIIIRGNSPRGLMWRLEGVEVPSPNHFTDQGASSGSVSVLSSNMLATSDFFTGAFPAEYGNALSGVFDIKLRRGNNEKREYALRAGVIGLDASIEGPFQKGKQSSYLANYRYSTLALLDKAGIKLVDNSLPIFQDLAFNLNFPTKKLGTFSLYGVGGLSNQTEFFEGVRQDGTYGKVYDEDFGSNVGIAGLTHQYNLSNKTYLFSVLSFSASAIDFQRNVFSPQFGKVQTNNEDFKEYTSRVSVLLNHKFNAQHVVRVGAIYSHIRYDLLSQSPTVFDTVTNKVIFNDDINDEGDTDVMQAYVNWKYRITDKLSLNTGLHSMYFVLNGKTSIEPRVGAKWAMNEKQSLSAGFGLHSRREGLATYLAKRNVNGVQTQPNEKLNFTKALHYVLGYDHYLTKSLHFRAEAYYQSLFDVPVVDNSFFSILNEKKGFTGEVLVNKGTGENYGLELTLEKFLSNNYYFATNVSLFESTYKGGDNKKRNTLYNSNYIANALVGKDFPIGQNKTFNLNGRGVFAGGQRYIPLELQQFGPYPVIEKAFDKRLKDYFRADLQASYTVNRPKSTLEFRLEIQNITDRANVRSIEYIQERQAIVERKRGQLLPVFSVQVKF